MRLNTESIHIIYPNDCFVVVFVSQIALECLPWSGTSSYFWRQKQAGNHPQWTQPWPKCPGVGWGLPACREALAGTSRWWGWGHVRGCHLRVPFCLSWPMLCSGAGLKLEHGPSEASLRGMPMLLMTQARGMRVTRKDEVRGWPSSAKPKLSENRLSADLWHLWIKICLCKCKLISKPLWKMVNKHRKNNFTWHFIHLTETFTYQVSLKCIYRT